MGPATGAALALLVASAHAASTARPSRMVLHVPDLPPGFVVVRSETGPQTNGDLIRSHGRALAPKLRRWGRITGYRALYRQRDPVNGSLPGVLEFGAAVGLYRSAPGAHASSADRSSPCRQKGYTIIGLGGHRPVGPDTIVCTLGARARGVRVRIFLVTWRNGRATGGVFVGAVEGSVTALTALIGARKQNHRMAAELR
jgi:hypothetical protein